MCTLRNIKALTQKHSSKNKKKTWEENNNRNNRDITSAHGQRGPVMDHTLSRFRRVNLLYEGCCKHCRTRKDRAQGMPTLARTHRGAHNRTKRREKQFSDDNGCAPNSSSCKPFEVVGLQEGICVQVEFVVQLYDRRGSSRQANRQ